MEAPHLCFRNQVPSSEKQMVPQVVCGCHVTFVASLPSTKYSVTMAVGEDIRLSVLYMGRLRPSKEPIATREFKRETRAVIHMRPLNAVSRFGQRERDGRPMGKCEWRAQVQSRGNAHLR